MQISAMSNAVSTYKPTAASPVAKQAAPAAAAASQPARAVDGDGDNDGSKSGRLDVRV